MKKPFSGPLLRLWMLALSVTLFIAGCAVDSGGSDDEESTPPPVNTPTEGSGGGGGGSGSALPRVTIRTADGSRVSVLVEVADTAAEQTTGLMFRESLDEFAGMLFVFTREDNWQFTMENTLIPLDMIHFDADRRVVGIVEYATPETPGPYSVATPSLYVLEVNGGFAERQGVSIGDRVEFIGITD